MSTDTAAKFYVSRVDRAGTVHGRNVLRRHQGALAKSGRFRAAGRTTSTARASTPARTWPPAPSRTDLADRDTEGTTSHERHRSLATKTVLWRLPPPLPLAADARRGWPVQPPGHLTDAQFAALADQAICRCAVSVRDKACARMEVA